MARSFCPVSNPPPYGCEVEAMTELMTVRLAELVNALRQKNAPTGDVCRGKLTHKETMSVKSTEWEETRPKGGCQCHACGDDEGQGQNYGCRHGSAPFLATWRLSEQGKDSRDRHHVLELFAPRAGAEQRTAPNTCYVLAAQVL